VEGSGFGFPFGGDPEDLMRGLRDFAEQQAESVQEAQREQFATLTLNTAVELTAAALQQVYDRIDKLEPSAAREQWYRPHREWFQWPLALALLFSIPAVFMRGRK